MSDHPEPAIPMDRLPHRPPFRFVTGIASCDRERIVATWRLDGSEDFFRGHFPGDPIVPGVLLGEALAQSAGLLLGQRPDIAAAPGRTGYLARIELRFHVPARPPTEIRLEAQYAGGLGTVHQFEVTASCGATRVASGTLALAVPPA